MNVMKQLNRVDESVFIPLMVFLGALTLSDFSMAFSILFAFLTIVFIPGNLITYYLIPEVRERIYLAVPVGFGLLPGFAYILGIFNIPLVNPLFPILFSGLSLMLIKYKKKS